MENLELLRIEELSNINGGEPTRDTSFGYDVGYAIGTMLTAKFWEDWSISIL